MKNYHLLTSSNSILRKFAQNRYSLNDLHKWKIIESLKKIPKPFEFIINLNLSNQNLNEIKLKTLYCLKLNCSLNQLTNLPNLPYCKVLFCYNNKLNKLPKLPYCKVLYCGNNKLINLPNLHNCEKLNCYNNLLTSLPDLPYCKKLYCPNNKLTTLPNLHNCEIVY